MSPGPTARPSTRVDLLLHWAAQSTVFNAADTVVTGNGITAAADAEGNPIVIGPDGTELTAASGDAYTAAFDPEGETGAELLEGYTYKESTGVAFDAVERGARARHPVPGDLRGRPLDHDPCTTASTSTTRPAA